MTVSSAALTRFGPSRSSIFIADFFSSSVMTFRPLAFSSDVTVFLSTPSIAPVCGMPARSTALKLKVAIRLPARFQLARTGRHLDQLAQLLGARGARLGDLLRDPAGADEARQRGVHRLHAVRRAGLDAASRSGASCPRGSGCARRAWARAPRRRPRGPCRRRSAPAVCVTMPWRPIASWARTWPCWDGGKTSMMRSTVCGASCVWSVAKTRWPVSAAVSAVPIVSMSRISPTRITSGSWRSAAFSAIANDLRVAADLALVDDALLVAVEELDRVLDRHDVLVARLVDLVDDRGERRRLAGAGRAGDEHDAARLVRELADHRRQPELLDRHGLGGDQAEGRADRAALEVGVHAEACVTGDRVGEVDLPVGLQALPLRGVQDRVDDLARIGRASARGALDRHQRAPHAEHRRRTGGEVEVGGLLGRRPRAESLRSRRSCRSMYRHGPLDL